MGVKTRMEEGREQVSSVIAGGPAAAAGVSAADELVPDPTSIGKRESSGCVRMLRDGRGAPVQLDADADARANPPVGAHAARTERALRCRRSQPRRPDRRRP